MEMHFSELDELDQEVNEESSEFEYIELESLVKSSPQKDADE